MSLDFQFPLVVTTPLLGLVGTMMAEVNRARLICLFVTVKIGQSRQNSPQAMQRRVTFLDIQSPSVATTQSLVLLGMMMMDLIQARLMFSNATERVGRSRQNSQQAMQRRVTTSDIRFLSAATT